MNSNPPSTEPILPLMQDTIRPGIAYSEEQRRLSLQRMLAGLPAGGDVWVFAYGSLMWRPGFVPAQESRARVHGWHRALNVHAISHRGSLTQPGLWFGLERGGSVTGAAMRVSGAIRDEVLRQLWDREQPDDAYLPVWVSCRLAEGAAVQALSFAANRASTLYAGELSVAEIARRMQMAGGAFGLARCYLLRTQNALLRLGARDRHIDAVASRLRSEYGPCLHQGCLAP